MWTFIVVEITIEVRAVVLVEVGLVPDGAWLRTRQPLQVYLR